jgi:hypothetical protein
MELVEKLEKSFPNALALFDFYIENNKEALKKHSFQEILLKFCESEKILISVIPGYDSEFDVSVWKPMVVTAMEGGNSYVPPETYYEKKTAVFNAILFSFSEIEKKLNNKDINVN